MLKFCFLVFTAVTLSAQNTLSKEDLILKKLDRIDKRTAKIEKILEEADAPLPPIKVDVSHSPVLGLDKAPITIVEFTDFQCPYCSKFHTDTFPQLHDKFIRDGLVRFVSKDFPLSMHKNALQAAEAARCAEEQGHFWEMRDWMQSNPEKLELDQLREHASELDLDLEQYRNCMVTAKYRTAIQNEMKEAQKFNITGTPAFVIGKSNSIVEGDLIVGNQPLAVFEAKINSVITKGSK